MERTHVNPVYAGYFADPFVWRHDGTYCAVGTGGPEAKSGVLDVIDRAARAGLEARLFPLLQSDDLVTWTEVGGAPVPPNPAYGDHPYAPEVACADGMFYLYYSVGRMNQVRQLGVAMSPTPTGPYVDSGRRLVDPFHSYFANDPHPFRDVDGTWYLFYSRDFIDTDDGWRVGGGIVVDRLVDMRPSQARNDWCYDHASTGSGSTPPASGTATCGTGTCSRAPSSSTTTIGTGAPTAPATGRPTATGSTTRSQTARSDRGPTTARRTARACCRRSRASCKARGHCSIVVGPDDSTEYVVYHSWDREMRDRRMCIDMLTWTAEGPRAAGPTLASEVRTKR